jgi:excisionase family DNA binding protein
MKYKLITTEASEYLGVSINTLKTLANNGKIKSFKTTGEHRRFRQEDLDAYMGVEKGKYAPIYEQSCKRGVLRLILPRYTPKADRVAIAAAYGLDAPTGDHEQMVDEIIKGWGLGGFVFYLRSGKKLAAKRKQTPAWSHVQDAYKTIQNYSRFG